MNESTYHVLVVDDNRMNRLKMARALSSGDYDVSEASSGEEAMEKLRSHDFHLVLLDLVMPEIDGFQVLEKMQTDQRLVNIPVIMVSAVDEQEDVEKCLAMGAVDYISKPFDAGMLGSRVKACLDKARPRNPSL